MKIWASLWEASKEMAYNSHNYYNIFKFDQLIMKRCVVVVVVV